MQGPADVVLTVEEPARPPSFRVQGSATLGGFTFVVRLVTPGRVWEGGQGWLTHPPHRCCLCPGPPHQHPAPPVWTLGGWHPPLAPRHPSLSREQLARDSQWLRVPPGRAAQVRPCPRRAQWGPWHGDGHGISPVVLLSPPATATVSPRQGNGVIRCTVPAAGGLGAAWVSLWIDGEQFPAPLPFQYRPDPLVSSVDPICSFE